MGWLAVVPQPASSAPSAIISKVLCISRSLPHSVPDAGKRLVDAGSSGDPAEIARLEELRLAALGDRIDADLASGSGGQLVAELEALVRGHRRNERFIGQLMLALYRSGRPGRRARRLSRREAVLDRRAGLEPGAELRAVERAILVQDPELIRAASGATGQLRPLPSGADRIGSPPSRIPRQSPERELGEARTLAGPYVDMPGHQRRTAARAGASAKVLTSKVRNWPNTPLHHTLKSALKGDDVPSFDANIRGDVAIAGNTLETCPENVARRRHQTRANRRPRASDEACLNANNNDHNMVYVDADPGGGRFDSSSATLTVPTRREDRQGVPVLGGRPVAWRATAASTDPTTTPRGRTPRRPNPLYTTAELKLGGGSYSTIDATSPARNGRWDYITELVQPAGQRRGLGLPGPG